MSTTLIRHTKITLMKKIFTCLASAIICVNIHNLFAQVNVQDSLALVDLYNSTGGPNWANQDNWLAGTVSTWYGILVTEGRVIAIGYRE